MPFIPNTPESLIQRSDSRNPADTCSGLTQSGRPCRRPIAGSPRSSKSSPPPKIPSQELGYCWQHQDQAGQNALPQGLQKSPIRERTSIDTLVDRLGLLEVESPVKTSTTRRRPHSAAPAVQSTTAHIQSQNTQISEKPSHRPRPKPEPEKTWNLLCCFIQADAGDEEPPRPAVKKQQRRNSAAVPSRPTAQTRRNEGTKLSPNSASRPGIGRDPPSRTTELLSLIPKEISPETTALLLTELAKPTSGLDEPGFIYIFWLTSENLPNKPPSEATSSLLAPPIDLSRPPNGRRRTSDVLQSFSTDPTSTRSPVATDKKPILLKIGRANNVQRRMNEWQRQCGYDVSLIRFYPYVDITSPSPSPHTLPSRGASRPSLSQSNTPRKVPNAHKVEKLIHLELTGRGKRAALGGKCERCGTAHREWFEIEGSKSGLREVDEVIRRWVEWGEREGGVA